EDRFIARHGVADSQRPARTLGDLRANGQLLIVARGLLVATSRLYDGKKEPGLLHCAVVHAVLAAECAARQLEPDEVVRMVRHLHLVGLEVTYPNGDFGEGHWRGPVFGLTHLRIAMTPCVGRAVEPNDRR